MKKNVTDVSKRYGHRFTTTIDVLLAEQLNETNHEEVKGSCSVAYFRHHLLLL